MTDLAARLTSELDERLAAADAALASGFPGERAGRQPVHTVYVPADRYDAGLVPAYGAAALTAVDDHADAFAELVGDDDIVARVRAKLAQRAGRGPADRLRGRVRRQVRRGRDRGRRADRPGAGREPGSRGEAAPFNGIRMKCFEAHLRGRAIRTLTSFVETLARGRRLDGRLGRHAARR